MHNYTKTERSKKENLKEPRTYIELVIHFEDNELKRKRLFIEAVSLQLMFPRTVSQY